MAVFAGGPACRTAGASAVQFEDIKFAEQTLLSRRTFAHGVNRTKNQTHRHRHQHDLRRACFAQTCAGALSHRFAGIVFEDREAFADPALFPDAVRTMTDASSNVSERLAIQMVKQQAGLIREE